MSLFAIGDLHLHFDSELKAPGQLRDPVWRNHETLFKTRCAQMVREDDTLLLAGDHSWGKNMQECDRDLEYICSLPGRKILLRGNHDMFWDPKKTEALNRMYEGRLFFLQNNFASYRDYAIVGTKGYTFEGPFYMKGNRVTGWDKDEEAHAQKLVEREAERLQKSIDAAKAAGYGKFLVFLHYPPTNILESGSVFTGMAEECGADQVIYAHCHGQNRFHDSILGENNGIIYRLVSGDYLNWYPQRIL